jgi:hypothetical protein
VIVTVNGQSSSCSPVASSTYTSHPNTYSIPCRNPFSNLSSGEDTFDYHCNIKNTGGWYATQSSFTDNFRYGGEVEIYHKPLILIKTPLSYRDIYADTVTHIKRHFTLHPSTDPLDTLSKRGIETFYIKYDGYGTLKLNGSVYYNVVRMHERRQIRDSSFFADSSTGSPYYHTTLVDYDCFHWYVQSMHHSKLNLQKINVLHIHGIQTDTFLKNILAGSIINMDTLTGVFTPSKEEDINATWNSNVITISGVTQKGSYSIFTSEGKLIKKGGLNPEPVNAIQIPPVSPGIYILKIRTDNGKETNIKLLKN